MRTYYRGVRPPLIGVLLRRTEVEGETVDEASTGRWGQGRWTPTKVYIEWAVDSGAAVEITEEQARSLSSSIA